MITMPVGEFKARFSEVLKKVEQGGEVIISYGKSHRNVAALVPYQQIAQRKKSPRKLGLLKGKASFKIIEPFEMTTEEFLNS